MVPRLSLQYAEETCALAPPAPALSLPTPNEDELENEEDDEDGGRTPVVPSVTPAGPSAVASPNVDDEDAPSEMKRDHSAEPISETVPEPPSNRRRSHSWKGFSLKKQLSRVDMKLKSTFAPSSAPTTTTTSGPPPVPIPQGSPANAGQSKRSSVFYSCSPGQLSPVGTDSPADLSEVDREEVSPDNSGDADPDEGPENVEMGVEATESELMSDSADDGDRVVSRRPADLALFDADGKPNRPPRRRESTMRRESKPSEKRDCRLLSVPNIKYHRPDHHNMRDLRGSGRNEAGTSGQPAFGGLIRRFSKCSLIPLPTIPSCSVFSFSYRISFYSRS